MKMKAGNLDAYIEEYNKQFDEICCHINNGNIKSSLVLLSGLISKFEPTLGDNHRELIHAKFVLAQLHFRLGNNIEARALFDMSVSELRKLCYGSKSYYIDIHRIYSNFLISIKDYQAAIKALTELKLYYESTSIEENSTEYFDTIEQLSILYSTLSQHKMSIEMDYILLEMLLKEHSKKHGYLLTAANIDFDEYTLNKLISTYCNIGASLARINEHIEARKYLEKGYFLAVTSYGDKDERTLNLY